MQFTTLSLAALSAAGALGAQMTTVHVVKVGGNNGSLVFQPNNLKAAVGDMVQFQFSPANHTVTQSTFDQPCVPISNIQKNVTGIFSGFMPVKAADTTAPTYTIMVNNTTPMWLFCSQGKHCQNGMTMVINVNPTANASRTLENYQALAKSVTTNLAPNTVSGGTAGTNSSSSSSSGSGSGSSGSGSGSGSSGSGTSSGSPSTSSSPSTNTTSFAVSVRPSEAISFTALLAMGLAFLL